MQAVCEQKPFGLHIDKAENFSRAISKRKGMNPAEVVLEWQIFLGGLAVSGMMLFVTSVFKLM